MSHNQSLAVAIQNGYKSFKGNSEENRINVLENFCMIVPTATLYSLLGSRSCGKTTVLSILIGKHKLDRGILSVFGCEEVPVSSSRWQTIGYMPQESGLYTSFSIYETFVFFAQLFNGGKNQFDFEYIKSRINYLRELLELPSDNRIVGSLSGGQKRRVSLAVALLNEPDLLLLDEPTNGLDPLMRNIIWEHLTWLSSTKKVTTIVTTHCIEEAKPSGLVGLMRNGRLVAEENPDLLVSRLNVRCLEDAFRRLCIRQEQIHEASSSARSNQLPDKRLYLTGNNKHEQKQFACLNLFQFEDSKGRIAAFAKKNFRNLIRTPFVSLSLILWPTVYLLLGSIVAKEPKGFYLGVLNHEVANSKVCCEDLSLNLTTNSEYLSCSFLQQIPSSILKLKCYDSLATVKHAAEAGKIWGYITFPQNYTTNVQKRQVTKSNEGLASEDVWNSSNIFLNMDQSSTLIYRHIVNVLQTTVQTFEKDEQIALSSLKYIDRADDFGKASFEEFVGPGYLTYLMLILPPLVSIRLINEKRLGVVERCFAFGANWLEILMGYAITEMTMFMVQSIVSYLVLYYILSFGPGPFTHPELVIPMLGILVLQSILGMVFGFFLGVLFSEEINAVLMILIVIFPNGALSGVYTALEGLPEFVQAFAVGLPVTWSTDAFRSLMNRRWRVTHPQVWPGFAVLIGYIVLLVLATVGVTVRQSKK